jgi:ABC-type nickel/cobalt efflux system permease component RcnA
MFAVTFYVELMLEVLVALGAALAIANGAALFQSFRKNPKKTKSVKNKSGKVISNAKAPRIRTTIYFVIGLIVTIWSGITLIARK